MKKIILFFILVITSFGFSQSTNQEVGKKFINDFLVDNNIKQSYSYFDENLKSKLTEVVLLETLRTLEKQLGKFKSVLETNSVKETYYYYSDFEKTKLDIKLSFNGANKIIGFYFSPRKDFKTEIRLGKELTIASNGLNLNGTLLVPEKDNLKKLVIFVHGSGANDRDEKIYENKPFKDIAEGLYQKGIATYRFDKRTFTFPESFTAKSTVDDEVTTDVVNIVNYFKKDTQFSGYEIIVLGHSLGAHLLPRIANKTSNLSKIILLAGNARPLGQLLIEQYEYLYSLNATEELKNELKEVREQVKFLNSKAFNLNVPNTKLPLNQSAYYWQSIISYNPLKEVQKVKIPILILQGERDYQVTMVDFNLWKKALEKNKKATFISYPILNHSFMSGVGKATPNEYTIKNNVDSKAIDDIFLFISK